jgi:hypothetical protein
MIKGRTIFSVVRKLAPHPGAKRARRSDWPTKRPVASQALGQVS